jgi:hypothetical protein
MPGDKVHRPVEENVKSPFDPESAVSDAPKGGQANLNRRGRKAHTAVTAAEAYFVLTGNIKQASLQAAYSAWWGYELLKMPRIQPLLREFEKRKVEEAWELAKSQVVLTREFLDELFVRELKDFQRAKRQFILCVQSGDSALPESMRICNARCGKSQIGRTFRSTTL